LQEDDSGVATFMMPSGETVKIVSPNGEVSEKIDTSTAGTFSFRYDVHTRYYINDILDEWKANRAKSNSNEQKNKDACNLP
jgi:hypothetical protein